MTVNLTAGMSFSTAALDTAGVGNDNFSGVNNVSGSNFDDTIIGSNANETLAGNTGNDTISGGGGSDATVSPASTACSTPTPLAV